MPNWLLVQLAPWLVCPWRTKTFLSPPTFPPQRAPRCWKAIGRRLTPLWCANWACKRAVPAWSMWASSIAMNLRWVRPMRTRLTNPSPILGTQRAYPADLREAVRPQWLLAWCLLPPAQIPVAQFVNLLAFAALRASSLPMDAPHATA